MSTVFPDTADNSVPFEVVPGMQLLLQEQTDGLSAPPSVLDRGAFVGSLTAVPGTEHPAHDVDPHLDRLARFFAG